MLSALFNTFYHQFYRNMQISPQISAEHVKNGQIPPGSETVHDFSSKKKCQGSRLVPALSMLLDWIWIKIISAFNSYSNCNFLSILHCLKMYTL